jgi:hypothetical protein
MGRYIQIRVTLNGTVWDAEFVSPVLCDLTVVPACRLPD